VYPISATRLATSSAIFPEHQMGSLSRWNSDRGGAKASALTLLASSNPNGSGESIAAALDVIGKVRANGRPMFAWGSTFGKRVPCILCSVMLTCAHCPSAILCTAAGAAPGRPDQVQISAKRFDTCPVLASLHVLASFAIAKGPLRVGRFLLPGE